MLLHDAGRLSWQRQIYNCLTKRSGNTEATDTTMETQEGSALLHSYNTLAA